MMPRLRDAAGWPVLKWLSLVFLLLVPACTSPGPAVQAEREYMFWPPAPDLPRIQYLTSISSTADVTQHQDSWADFLYGTDTTSDLPFQRPYGIRMHEGKLYICDATAATVAILDFRAKEVRVLGQTGQVRLSKPIDIAVAPDGVKYVTDTGHGAVLVYDRTDHYAGRIAAADLRPVGAAVHGNELFVADLASSLIRVFDRFNGRELRTMGGKGDANGQFGGVFGVALDSQGDIYANDIITCRIQKFAPDGKFLWRAGGLGDHPGQLKRPKLMAVDSSNYLYVVDYEFCNVQVFDESGALLTYFGSLGGFPGAMDGPMGVCVSDTDLDLFASYVHPAFQARRLIFVTNNIGPQKINVYALGDLKPGKTLADISARRVQGIFGLGEGLPVDTLPLEPGTQPGTAPATRPATRPATQPASTQPAATATAPAPPPETRPTGPGQQPF